MERYETPYGKKSAQLLVKSMDAYCREDKAVALMREMTNLLKQHAPTDATHDGLTVCDTIHQAQAWMELRDHQVQIAEENYPRS